MIIKFGIFFIAKFIVKKLSEIYKHFTKISKFTAKLLNTN